MDKRRNEMMNLPEVSFKPLSEQRLEAMIDVALARPQERAGVKVLAFPRKNWAFGGGMVAMAASILLAFLLTPVTGTLSSAGVANVATTASTDMGDMLLYDSLSS